MNQNRSKTKTKTKTAWNFAPRSHWGGGYSTLAVGEAASRQRRKKVGKESYMPQNQFYDRILSLFCSYKSDVNLLLACSAISRSFFSAFKASRLIDWYQMLPARASADVLLLTATVGGCRRASRCECTACITKKQSLLPRVGLELLFDDCFFLSRLSLIHI